MKSITFKQKRTAIFAVAMLGISMSLSHSVMAADDSTESAPQTIELKLAGPSLTGSMTLAGTNYNNCSGTAEGKQTGPASGQVKATFGCTNDSTQKQENFTVQINFDVYLLDPTWLKVADGSFIQPENQGSTPINSGGWARVDSPTNVHRCYTDTKLDTGKGPLTFNFNF